MLRFILIGLALVGGLVIAAIAFVGWQAYRAVQQFSQVTWTPQTWELGPWEAVPLPDTFDPAGIELAFVPGATIETPDGQRPVRTRDDLTLTLPSGRIVLAQLFDPDDSRPFTLAVPPGAYPLEVAGFHAEGAFFPAAARLVVSDAEPVRWVFADLVDAPAQEADPADDSSLTISTSYSSPDGTTRWESELDGEAAPILVDAAVFTDGASWKVDFFSGQLTQSVALGRADGANAIIVLMAPDSEWYWALDADDRPVALYAHFGAGGFGPPVDEPASRTAEPAAVPTEVPADAP